MAQKKDHNNNDKNHHNYGFFHSYLRIYAGTQRKPNSGVPVPHGSAKWDEAIQKHFHSYPEEMLKMMLTDYCQRLANNDTLTNPKQFFLDHLLFILGHFNQHASEEISKLFRQVLKDIWENIPNTAQNNIKNFFKSQDMQSFFFDLMLYEKDLYEEIQQNIYSNLKDAVLHLSEVCQFTIPQENKFSYALSFTTPGSNFHLIDSAISETTAVRSSRQIR